MPTHLGFSAWIVSGGEVLSEHLVAVDSKTNKVQCWIPSEEGQVSGMPINLAFDLALIVSDVHGMLERS